MCRIETRSAAVVLVQAAYVIFSAEAAGGAPARPTASRAEPAKTTATATTSRLEESSGSGRNAGRADDSAVDVAGTTVCDRATDECRRHRAYGVGIHHDPPEAGQLLSHPKRSVWRANREHDIGVGEQVAKVVERGEAGLLRAL